MLRVPVPPPAPNCNGAAVAETWHLVEEGAVADVDVDVQATESAMEADSTAQNSGSRKRIRSTGQTECTWLARISQAGQGGARA